MFKLLTKIFIKNSENVSDIKVRQNYATLSSIYGIVLNVLLFIGKYIAGAISGSVAIIADAFNNLSDAGSSVITLLGFLLAGKKPDKYHPFGHGRIEYLTGLIISAIIIVVGVELGISSVKKIISPEPVEVSLIPVLIMVAAILVKFYMFTYNRSVGKKIGSAALIATATDSLTDCIATLVTLISIGIAFFFKINVDGIAGLLVSLFILYAGISSIKDTLSPLLGQPPEQELVDEIEKCVLAHPEVKGIHDLIVHDYGPGRLMISLHAEVDGDGDIFELHDAIDLAEKDLDEKFNCLSTIHMDPIESNNPEVVNLRHMALEKINELYPIATIHDFRIVPGPTHTNLIFDCVLSMDEKDSDEDAAKKISDHIHGACPEYYAVVKIDRSYVGM